jgi:SAM-dependent methyltransferase
MLVGSSKYLFYRSYWLAMASSLAVVLGAIGPWTRLGIRVDGPQDAAVLTLGCIAFFVLFLGGTDQRWIAAAPLVIGLTAAGIVANDIRDPTDVTPGPGRITSLHWGIYLALVGSATLVLASALLLVDSRRRVRARGAERRVGARAERGGPERRVGRDGRRLPPGSKNLFYREKEAAGVPVRVAKILSFCELRRTDRVLDAGCAEGLITLELAPYVEHIHGFDLSAFRIEEAKRLADERGIENASFEVESVIGYPVEPLSYDVTIFAGVWGSKGVGFTELDNLLKATRRQLVAFIDLRYHRARVAPMYDICERNGFDVLCFASKFVIALRRGAESSVPEAPAVAVVPSTMLADHPVLRNARSVEELVLDEEDSSGLPELRRRP